MATLNDLISESKAGQSFSVSYVYNDHHWSGTVGGIQWANLAEAEALSGGEQISYDEIYFVGQS